MKNILLLGSKSLQRRSILTQAKIPFILVEQNADESQCDYGLPFPQLLASIALHKMNHIVMPDVYHNETAFVLTADTMIQDGLGTIYGKPATRNDAIAYIKALRDNPGMVGTAFCLDKKIYKNNTWHTEHRVTKFAHATFQLDISDHWIEYYLEQFPYYVEIAGALSAEEYGAQFIQSVNGSYGALLGLPIYELREALEAIGFIF